MKFSNEFCCNFIDVDPFPSSDHIPRHLKFITSHFYIVQKYDGGTKSV